jgi:2-keto-4-pentenoate hydratase/2-oxohepta-3-ene-1,7-dioic acid hydratase in catechol pathway
MKLVTFRTANNETAHAGVAVDGRIAEIAEFSGVVDLLGAGERGLAAARALEAAAKAGKADTLAETDVTLLAAVPNPPTIFLLAGNYQAHLIEGGGSAVDKAKITPRPFIKPGTSVAGSGDSIQIPPDSDTLDYEIEIAAVIGTAGRDIALDQAEAHIGGYVVFNDISARSLKISAGRTERNGDWFFDWLLGKWCDSFAVVGPYLVTRDEIGDPTDLEMSLKVNGVLRQHSAAGDMIFSVPETIAFLSRFVTLRPGDLICMGTPGGVGDTTQTYLQPGDVVETSIEKLGSMTNTVTKRA